MSGFHPLSPGLRLMRRLRLRGKLLLLAAAAVVPLLLAWALQGPDGLHGGALAVAVVGLALLAYLKVAFYASFTADFQQVLVAMEQTVAGNLRSSLRLSGQDELGDLSRLLDRTIGNLSAMVAEVRSNSALVAHAGKSLARPPACSSSPAPCIKTRRPRASRTSRRPSCGTWPSRAQISWGVRSNRWRASRRAPSRWTRSLA
jgi:methyl-accepting chemotaxis protein